MKAGRTYAPTMEWETNIIKRDELYLQVWAKPMRNLAKEYGISDSGLAKICKKLEIPRPGRGYWARKAAGQDVEKEPLPTPGPRTPTQHRVSRWQDPFDHLAMGDEALSLLEREDDASMAISVPNELHNPHKWIRKSAGFLKRNSQSQAKLRNERACVDIIASRSALDRALRIVDTLFKALEERGLKVEITEPVPYAPGKYGGPSSGSPSKTGVHILGTFIKFGIVEGVNITKKEQEPVNYRSNYSYTPASKYNHELNGKLALKIYTSLPGQNRQTWGDGKRQRVEDCLKPFVVALIQGAERSRLDRLERARQQREREEEQKRRQEEARLQELERAKIADLNQRIDNWAHAAKIRDFIAEVEAASYAQGDDTSPETPLGQWITWAKSRATRLHNASLKIEPISKN
ncbi:MAG: hypothetical protein KOO63_13620 [Bacteroidales bacterium]|nr:hypothetical protein [Candidatus Latescibacterota bacterium]